MFNQHFTCVIRSINSWETRWWKLNWSGSTIDRRVLQVYMPMAAYIEGYQQLFFRFFVDCSQLLDHLSSQNKSKTCGPVSFNYYSYAPRKFYSCTLYHWSTPTTVNCVLHHNFMQCVSQSYSKFWHSPLLLYITYSFFKLCTYLV